MNKIPFVTKKGPKSIGPYSSAVIHGDLVFVSGMGPIEPKTNEIVPGTIEDESHCTFKNVQIVLEELGCSLSDVIKTTLYLVDMNDFKAVNSIYSQYFGPDYPARTTVQVTKLPLDIKLEIDVVSGYGSKSK